MKAHQIRPLRIAVIYLSLLLSGCQDFGAVARNGSDSGTTSALMSCDGTKTNPDLTCSAGSINGATCTMDCCYPAGISTSMATANATAGSPLRTASCGIANLGYKACLCPNGVYEWCSCLTPPQWPRLPAGGDCFPAGTSAAPPAGISGASCTKEWTTCWTAEVAGNRGCVCLRDPTTGNLNLRCGSPGTWFLRVRGVTTPY